MAQYFCSGVLQDQEQFRHYALNVPLYTHFTSPIRRFADIVVHRLLAAALGKAPRWGAVPAHASEWVPSSQGHIAVAVEAPRGEQPARSREPGPEWLPHARGKVHQGSSQARAKAGA